MTDKLWRRYNDALTALEAAVEEPAIKESLTVAEQEPVAYIRVSKTGNVTACAMTGDFYKLPEKTLLYPAPPRREWVGLTDEEINLIYAEPQTHVGQYAKAIEAKLRDKNK